MVCRMEKKQEEQNTIHYHPLCQTRRQIPSTQNEGRSGTPDQAMTKTPHTLRQHKSREGRPYS
jgi:hypothetical protein